MNSKDIINLKILDARRMAVAAQGLHLRKRNTRIDQRHFKKIIKNIALVQLDSVQAVCRSHYLVFFSRLGNYDQKKLDNWLWHSEETFESWSHEASVMSVDLEPNVRWMKTRASLGETWKGLYEIGTSQKRYVDLVLEQVKESPAIKASDLSDPKKRDGTWWSGRSDGQRALEWLFRTGKVGVRRDANFGRNYELYDSVLPQEILSKKTPIEEDAKKNLLLKSALCHGVGTASDLADYFRMKVSEARPLLTQLTNRGLLNLAEVEGWSEIAYLHPSAAKPKQLSTRALVSPFDPLVWCRPRIERLFNYKFRLEIYVPSHKREYGYYVLPFLLNENLVARVDLKSDRSKRKLFVRGAYVEENNDLENVASELLSELKELSIFLGLERIVVEKNNTFSSHLASLLNCQQTDRKQTS